MLNLFTSLALLAAAPLALGQAVLYPRAGTTWFAGQAHNVTWTVPASGSYVGQLQLTKGGDLSTTPAPLTPVNFTVTTGRVQITVPNVQTGTDYGLLLTLIPTAGGESVSSLSGQFSITNTSPATSSFVAGTSAAGTGASSASGATSTGSGSGSVTASSSVTTGSGTGATGATTTIVSGSSTIVVVGGSTETGASGTSVSGGSTVNPTGTATVTSSSGASTATAPSSSGATTTTAPGSGSQSSTGSNTASSSSASSATTSSGALSVKPLGGQTWFVAAAFAVLGSALVL